ncbi:hypothetical protein SKAU_G00258140 [Synaphobranchus kaupii]|uniref:Uncharacterized protein n=1 Tax=Synaphobranchus kaupii TaxID=118154 RepID=A0A9Q1F474_SYNKA|nr:hypothetical protein SKAU_G00258140 [Synaphobranchus kaupii]
MRPSGSKVKGLTPSIHLQPSLPPPGACVRLALGVPCPRRPAQVYPDLIRRSDKIGGRQGCGPADALSCQDTVCCGRNGNGVWSVPAGASIVTPDPCGTGRGRILFTLSQGKFATRPSSVPDHGGAACSPKKAPKKRNSRASPAVLHAWEDSQGQPSEEATFYRLFCEIFTLTSSATPPIPC